MANENPPIDSMKTAHVLFMDIVGYSKLPIDEQTSSLHILQEIVHGAAQVARAQAANQLTSIPTGDGMALVFFSEPTAPVECAMEVGKALKSHPEIQLRMGVHSGPVNEIIDVNGRINVAGSGINMAQRVMDSGDAGHILLSKRVAEDLSQYTRWQPLLHDLREVDVKHAVRVHLFNLYTDEVGNPVLPARVKSRKKRTLTPWIIAAALAAIIIPTGIVLLLKNRAGPSLHPTPTPTSVSSSPIEEPSPKVEGLKPTPTIKDTEDVTPIDWGTIASFKGEEGKTFRFRCPEKGTAHPIYGSDVYAEISSICTAAVHAGLFTLERGGIVTIEYRPGRSTYGSTVRNGITSETAGEHYSHSFVVR